MILAWWLCSISWYGVVIMCPFLSLLYLDAKFTLKDRRKLLDKLLNVFEPKDNSLS